MKYRPPDFKHGDKIVMDEKVISVTGKSIHRVMRRHHSGVEDSCVLCKPGAHKIGFHLRNFLRRRTRAEFRKDFQPCSEPIRVISPPPPVRASFRP